MEDELSRLRSERTVLNRERAAEIEALRRSLIADRKAINAKVNGLVAERKRLARIVRVLDAT